ncbi:MAG: membrane protein insertion efficiency factor YidD [Bacteroidia bacterium]|nr:membrane protein insertion efficiency factor YidD [Bacteroidia bacterium]
MKFVFLNIIKLYWLIVPAHKRRPCVFKESCSKYVFRIFLTQGSKQGFSY